MRRSRFHCVKRRTPRSVWFSRIRCSSCERHLTALPAGTNATSPKVLNCSDKCFSCTFWIRVVKLSIHEHFRPPPTGAVARTLRASPCALTAPREKRARNGLFWRESGIKCETATARTRMRHTHFLVCGISAPPPSGEQSEARG